MVASLSPGPRLVARAGRRCLSHVPFDAGPAEFVAVTGPPISPATRRDVVASEKQRAHPGWGFAMAGLLGIRPRCAVAAVSAVLLLAAGCGAAHGQGAGPIQPTSPQSRPSPSATGYVKRADFLTGVACLADRPHPEPLPGRRVQRSVVPVAHG